MLEWVILYHDQSTFSNLDGEAKDAPRHGVMETFFYDTSTGVSVESSPIGYWVWKSNRWFGIDDQMGFWDHMFHYSEPVIALFGRTLHDLEWQKDIHVKTLELMKIPKNAWRNREHRS